MIIHNPVITGSFQINGNNISSVESIDNVSSSVVLLNDASASFSTRVTAAESSVDSLNSASSSYLLNTTDILDGDLTVTGKITAQEFHTEFVSASIIYQSGSTQFGNSADDTHVFTGSAFIQPGLTVTGDGTDHIIKAVRAGNTRLFVGNAVNTVGINTETVNNPLTVNGSADFSGNIGIGTTDTSANLTFTSETGSRKIALYTVSDNDYQFYGFGIADNTLVYHTAATSDDHVFYAGTSSTTRNELMRIGGDGKVGIGVDTPNEKLHISGNIRAENTETLTNSISYLEAYQSSTQFMRLHYLNSSYTSAGSNLSNSGLITAGSGATSGMVLRTDANAPIIFVTNGSVNERMRITGVGNVGIGTNNPSKRLTVRYDENGDPTVLTVENKNANANVGAFIGFSTGYNGTATIGAKREGAENDSSLIFSPMLNESAVERMRITSTGYVGINTDAPAASLHIGNNVSSGGFGGFGDFQILLYQGASAATSYGLGIEGNTLMYNSQNYHKFYSSNNALGFISDDFSTLSNSNSGRHLYENKGGRVLTSNGTGWLADGRDPILTLATAGDSNNLSIAESIGLNLYTAGTSNGVHSPAIAFSNRSNSGDYESAFGIIIGKKTGQGVDSNWSAGELHFYTGKEAGYMDNNPDLKINSKGHIVTVRQPAFFAHTGPTAYNTTTTAIPFSVEFTDNGNNYNSTNGRFTAPTTGRYYFFASALHRMASAAGSGEISFYKNGANVNSRGMGYAGGGTLDDDHDQVTISMIISLAAGDYVTVGVYAISSGQDFYTQAGLAHFGGYLIG